MSILTVYPDPAPGTTSKSGGVGRLGQNTTLSSIRNGAGTSTDTGSFIYLSGLFSNGSSNFQDCWRSLDLFDTSALGSSATIISATMSLYGNAGNTATMGLSDANAGLALVDASPASDTTMQNSDYENSGTTRQATDLGFSTVDVSSYFDFTLNATGLASINKTGITKFAVRLVAELDTVSFSPGANKESSVFGYDSNNTGTSKDPKLVINYTTVVTTGNMLLAF